ncbi:hypothetical protein F4810DRAFT_253178 [Camillea tinctor]|nr:hypothetical protein F4810DRAFT_253178 [Camillea tinctor]
MHAENPPSKVSGPTVLFWMVSFALNAMAQPTGPVSGNVYCKLLCCSPVISLSSALHLAGCWCRRAASSFSARSAATQVLAERTEVAAKKLKADAPFRRVGFVFGVLPQFIKLFGSTGLFWVQFFGAMYLFAWLVFELLVLVAYPDPGDNSTALRPQRTPSKKVMLLGYLALLTQDMLYVRLYATFTVYRNRWIIIVNTIISLGLLSLNQASRFSNHFLLWFRMSSVGLISHPNPLQPRSFVMTLWWWTWFIAF